MVNIVNRYKQLLASIPPGSFYASEGQLIPYRSSPYSLRIQTSVVSSEYRITVNDEFRGNVVTDAQGLALVNVSLVLGSNELRLTNVNDATSVVSYLTTKDYATLLASEAEIVETIDLSVEQLYEDSHLETASAGLIEKVFGSTVKTANNFGYDLDTYRELLRELRSAYRHWGGTTEGLYRVTRAFTCINPLLKDISFMPRWILGADTLYDKQSPAQFSFYTTSTLPNINSLSAGVSLQFSGGVGIGSGTLTYGVTGARWTPPGGIIGPAVSIPSNGTYTLHAGEYINPIWSVTGPFNIVAGVNDLLKVSVNGALPVVITLAPGGAVTAATIATAINTASIGITATAVGALFKLVPTTVVNASIKIFIADNDDVAQTLFNLPVARGGLSIGYAASLVPTTIVLSALTDMTAWPDVASATDPFYVLIGRSTFHPVGTPNAAATITSTETVKVVGINKATKTLSIASLANAHVANELVALSTELVFNNESVKDGRSVTLTKSGAGALPVSSTDVFTIAGSSVPNLWVHTTNAGAPTPSLAAPTSNYFSLDKNIPFNVVQDGMVSFPVPQSVLKYKGFPVRVVVWAKVDDPTSAATQTTVASINLSFDNQASYTTPAMATSGIEVNAQWRPRAFSCTVDMPIDATKMWVRIKTNAIGNGNLTIHKVVILIPVADGLFLGSGTTPRSENQIKNGQVLYVWEPNQLTANETAALGMPSPTASNGHIDSITPDFTWLNKYDVTEWNLDLTPKNVAGYFSEFQWISSISSTNMNMVLRTPSRFTFMQPTTKSAIVQNLTWNLSNVATLDIISDQDQSKAILFENGIPLFKDQWLFVSGTQVQLLFTFDSTVVYEFRYNALIQFETVDINLGANFADYVWFADYDIFTAPLVAIQEMQVTTGVDFDSTNLAHIVERSNLDQSRATLTADVGTEKVTVPISQWSFVDENTIRVLGAGFNPSAIYIFTYTAQVNHTVLAADVTVEIKPTSGPVTPYRVIGINDVLGNDYQTYKMRVTINNLTNVADVRIKSLVIKGLNLYGVGGTIPLLRP